MADDTVQYDDFTPNQHSTPSFRDIPSPDSPKIFLDSIDKNVYVIKTPESDKEDTKPASVTDSKSNGERSRRTSTIPESDRTLVYGVDENEERGNWTGRFDFLLSMLGYSVGLGNIWRFPYICYRNGGGAFLVPYTLMLIVVGIPLFYLETSLGQFSSCGPLTCWGFAPLFQGLGVAMVIVSGIVSIYYNMIVTWAVFYFFASFTSDLPWSRCNNDWNSLDCSLNLPTIECTTDEGTKYLNGTCYNNGKLIGLYNETMFKLTTGRQRVTPSEEYWANYVLALSDGIEDVGSPRWQITLTLLFSWIVCFLCLIKGIKTTGKVVYFTAIFPYVVLIILFIRGVTLPNAEEGIYFYIVPKFEKILDAKVWRDGALQVFYSLGPGWGGLIALSSYNRFHNNILGDAIIVSLGDGLTSVFGGFVIFSYLGYMAGQLQVGVEDVVKSGAGLAFVVYPEAVNSLPPSTLWSILFFFMLITLGLDSQFAMLETVLTGLTDYFPHLRKKKSFVIMGLCIGMFLLGLPMAAPGGMYWLQLLDHYAGSWSLLIIGLTEVLVIDFVYGINRFCSDIAIMQGYRPSIWWKICWLGISPLGIVFILIFSWVDYSPVYYDDYTYPVWADVLGWLISFSSIIFIPAVIIYRLYKEDEGKTFWQKLMLQLTPTRDWGPALTKHRKLVNYVDGFVEDPAKERRGVAYVNMGFNTSVTDLGTTPNGSIHSNVSTNQSQQTGRSYLSRSTFSHVSSYESTL